MAGSTLNRQREAADAIDDVAGVGPPKICYDTFHFYRASDAQLVPEMIGLIHVSGICSNDSGFAVSRSAATNRSSPGWCRKETRAPGLPSPYAVFSYDLRDIETKVTC